MGGGEWRRLGDCLATCCGYVIISEIDIEYAERRCAGGGKPVAARRAIPGTPGLRGCGDIPGRPPRKLEGQAPPGRDICPRSSEQLICRCRGQIGPESDGGSDERTIAKGKRPPWHCLAGDGPAMPSARDSHQRAF